MLSRRKRNIGLALALLLCALGICLVVGGALSGHSPDAVSRAYAATGQEASSARQALEAAAPLASGDALQAQTAKKVKKAKPAKPTAKQLKAFKKASADFSIQLFQRCVAAKGKNANVTVSPMSVMNALAVTANGAAGKTAAQMRKVIGGGASQARINKNLSWYNSKLVNSKKARLKSANALWYHECDTLKMKKAFVSTVRRAFNANVQSADFANPATVDSINAWAADNTDNMIKRIVGQLQPEDRLVIANALCFDAEWLTPYDKGSVRKAAFHAANGKKRKVDMMYGTEQSYIETDNATGFIKPYAKGYSYVALLPNKGMNAKSYVASLTGDSFRKAIAGAKRAVVRTGLPKYSLDYDNDNMQSQLAAMGMPQAFAPNANFSKMGKDTSGNLYLGQVVHKTKIDVDEQGTKAAAVTAVFVKASSAFIGDVKSVVLDRPFVYAIVDNATKLPIFIGTVSDL
ncbi:MAG TPA: serine protease [Eggerthellaceae bacterium]|nr:serine protease [Eggerthellaceae bacterium]